MSLIDPVKIIAPDPLAPDEKVRPAVAASVSVPWATLSETCSGLAPASGSLVEIPLPLADEKTRVLSTDGLSLASTLPAPGTELTGAWLTCRMLTVLSPSLV